MKTWLARMRISAALDEGRESGGSSPQDHGLPAELRDFEREMTALDSALKQSAPRPQAPASLHASIMRAVKETDHRVVKAWSGLAFLRWLPVPVAAALVFLVLLHQPRGRVQPPPRGVPSLAGASAALEAGSEMARSVPLAVVAPLTDELQNLNRDLDTTAKFLLSSLP